MICMLYVFNEYLQFPVAEMESGVVISGAEVEGMLSDDEGAASYISTCV